MRTLFLGLLIVAPALAAPPEVVVVKPVEREWFDSEDFTGRTDAREALEIRSRMSGLLEKTLFEEGALVKKGDLLFQIDSRAQKVEVDQTKAEMQRAEAKLRLVEVERQRAVQLEKAGGISKEEIDKLTAELESAKANLVAIRARLELAMLNLDTTRITAPISGRIGRRLISEGNLIKSGETLLTTLVSTEPLYVHFDVPERSALRVLRMLREDPETKLTVDVRLAADESKVHKAVLSVIDNRVHPETGTMVMRATLAEAKSELLPGLYAMVRLNFGPSRKVLMVPSSAIVTLAGQPCVLVVGEKNRLIEREVKIGPLKDGQRIIEAGLRATDHVLVNPVTREGGQEVKPLLRKEAPAAKSEDKNTPRARSPVTLPGTGIGLIVSTSYPGANAQTVEQIVAAPLIEQLRGMEYSTFQHLECTDSGEMLLTLGFKKGTDLDKALLLTQNRLALAVPQLPEEVRHIGVAVRKRPVHLASVALVCPDGKYDRNYLSRYAELRIKDELIRTTGLAEVTFHGDPLPGDKHQVHIDRERLAAFGVTAAEVSSLLNEHLAGNRRSVEADTLLNLVVKSKDGKMIRIRDVARIDVVSDLVSITSIDGKPCVTLRVARSVDAEEVATLKSLRAKIAELRKNLPVGLELRIIEE